MVNRQQLQRLYSYCITLTLDPAAAESLLLSCLDNKIKPGTPQSYNHAYMRMVIRNQFIDNCHSQSKMAFEPPVAGMPSLMDEACLADLQLQCDSIEILVYQLNVAEREVLYLWAVDGYNTADIAIELNQARGVVLSRLHEIKQGVVEQKIYPAAVGETLTYQAMASSRGNHQIAQQNEASIRVAVKHYFDELELNNEQLASLEVYIKPVVYNGDANQAGLAKVILKWLAGLAASLSLILLGWMI